MTQLPSASGSHWSNQLASTTFLTYDETYTKTAMSHNNAPRHAGSRESCQAHKGGDERKH